MLGAGAGTYSAQPSYRQSAVAPPTLAWFIAPRINISRCWLSAAGVLSWCGGAKMASEIGHQKSSTPEPLSSWATVHSRWVLSGLVQRAHARLPSMLRILSVSSRDE